MYKYIVSLIFMFIITACSHMGVEHNKLFFNEIVIKNGSNRGLEGLEIRVSKLNRVFSCSVVSAKAFCANKFKVREYEGNSITLNWRENNNKFVKGPLVVEPPISEQGAIYSIIFTLNIGGEYSVSFNRQRVDLTKINGVRHD